MNLIKFNPMFPWGDDFDKMFDEMMPSRMMRRGGMAGFMPAVDVYDNKKDVVVEMPVTHIDPEKVDISIKDNMLHVKGATQKKTEVEDKNYYRREISSGSFYRTIPLPTDVIPEKTSAIVEDGVLKISMPKAKETKKKEIKVEVKKGKKKPLTKKKN